MGKTLHPRLLNLCQFKPVLLIFLLTSFSGYAQRSMSPQRNCSTMEYLEEQAAQIPAVRRQMKAIEQQAIQYRQSSASASQSTGIITVPVVVHVVHNTSIQNISDAQIRTQIEVLNKDFRRLNTDADNTWGQATDSQIEFALATIAPDGSSTNGITRTQTSTISFSANNDIKYSARGGKNAWSTDKYLNIWVGNLEGNRLGYAQFPGGGAYETDGVVISYKYFGTIGTATAPFNLGRTTTHEVGHWLNLRHIWGDGDCNYDDFVSDTPLADAANYSCNVGHSSCGGVNMIQNYMDYSDDACMNLFTEGQKARMHALFASGGFRENILKSPGLGNGDVENPTPGCTNSEVTLKITFDNYPEETTWVIKNSAGTIVASGEGYANEPDGSTITKKLCLPIDCYDFTITDAYNDGMCCEFGNGSYQLINTGGDVLAMGGNFGSSETKNICVGANIVPVSCPKVNFNDYSIATYSNQDFGTYEILDDGATLFLTNNAWKSINYNYTVTKNTVLEFEFRSTTKGEVHAIGFDNDNRLSAEKTFRVFGTQSWGIGSYTNYTSTSWKKYIIPVGDFYTGSFTKLFFVADQDNDPKTGNSYFRNVKIYEESCGNNRLAEIQRVQNPIVDYQGENELEISLFPNPASQVLNIYTGSEVNIQIVGLTGKRVWKGVLKAGDNQINISSLANGFYTLTANTEEGTVITKKFIKE